MRRFLGVAAVVIGILGAIWSAADVGSKPGLPPNPHRWMDEKTICTNCHDLDEQEIDPHRFILAIPEECWKCHSPEKLGRSHPIGVDPWGGAKGAVVIPEDLPLEEGKISCGTCHQPHMAWLSRVKCGPNQPPKIVIPIGREEVEYFSTFFARKSDPVDGFAPLCLTCHTDF